MSQQSPDEQFGMFIWEDRTHVKFARARVLGKTAPCISRTPVGSQEIEPTGERDVAEWTAV
jgi:hypothetical protein